MAEIPELLNDVGGRSHKGRTNNSNTLVVDSGNLDTISLSVFSPQQCLTNDVSTYALAY